MARVMTFIPVNVPSLKNSKVATKKGVFPSKTVRRYLQAIGVKSYSARKKEVLHYATKPNLFWNVVAAGGLFSGIEYPVRIGFHFVRKSRHKFDFHNAVQIIADLLVAHTFIEDDNMDYFIPYPLRLLGRDYSYDKEKPGVWIARLEAADCGRLCVGWIP